MAQSKFTLYKYIKLADGSWRYCKAAFYSNGKIKPNRCIVGGKEEEHLEGSYYLYQKKSWVLVGTDALDAQRRRNAQLDNYELNRLRGTTPAQSPTTAAIFGKTPLATASQRYFSNLEARGADPKTIRTYRSAVDPFIENCAKSYVEDVIKQDIINFIGWLRKQPLPQRKHSNPQRTYANKFGHVAIFLKAFGVSKLLRKNEYPRYHKKKVVAHPDEELALLYSHASDEDRFLMDFLIGTMAREMEAARCCYRDLTGTTLTLYGKQQKTRTVDISPRLAGAINERRKRSESEYLFPNRNGKPNQHLLRNLQSFAKRAGAKFHTELHKLRKTRASRRYLAGFC